MTVYVGKAPYLIDLSPFAKATAGVGIQALGDYCSGLVVQVSILLPWKRDEHRRLKVELEAGYPAHCVAEGVKPSVTGKDRFVHEQAEYSRSRRELDFLELAWQSLLYHHGARCRAMEEQTRTGEQRMGMGAPRGSYDDTRRS